MSGMVSSLMGSLRRPIALAVFGAAVVGSIALPSPAAARVRIGCGFPLFFGVA